MSDEITAELARELYKRSSKQLVLPEERTFSYDGEEFKEDGWRTGQDVSLPGYGINGRIVGRNAQKELWLIVSQYTGDPLRCWIATETFLRETLSR